MYYLVKDIKIKPFSCQIPDVYSFSKLIVKPYLRAQLFLFNTIEYQYEQFHMVDDYENQKVYRDYTSTVTEQPMDYSFDPDEGNIPADLPTTTYNVHCLYQNMLVIFVYDDDIEDSDGDVELAVYNKVISELPIDFIYSNTVTKY